MDSVSQCIDKRNKIAKPKLKSLGAARCTVGGKAAERLSNQLRLPILAGTPGWIAKASFVLSAISSAVADEKREYTQKINLNLLYLRIHEYLHVFAGKT
jgi:hypothetical protein